MDPQPIDSQVALTDVGTRLRLVADFPDPLARAREAEELTGLVQGLVVRTLADVRRAAIAQAVAGSSAAVVAEQLGISRARVYALVDGRGAVGTTRPRRTRESR